MKYLIVLLLISCASSKKSNNYKIENGQTVVYKKTPQNGITKDILSTGDTLVTDMNTGNIYIVKKSL